jgi:hypothetical protein
LQNNGNQNILSSKWSDYKVTLFTTVTIVNKPGGGNYADCDGVYIKDSSQIVNKEPIFTCTAKYRYIFKNSDGKYSITGYQYL